MYIEVVYNILLFSYVTYIKTFLCNAFIGRTNKFKVLGHNSSKTTEIYTHVSNKNLSKIQSLLDRLLNE